MKFLTELINRWKLESPKFHKKLISFGNWAFASGIGLIGLPAAYNGITGVEEIDFSLMVKIASYLIVIGLCISIVAKTAVKDPDYTTLDKKE